MRPCLFEDPGATAGTQVRFLLGRTATSLSSAQLPEKLVAELTAPGGVRAAVPRDQMRKFVAACAARDVCEAVCVLLASCLSAEVRP